MIEFDDNGNLIQRSTIIVDNEIRRKTTRIYEITNGKLIITQAGLLANENVKISIKNVIKP